MKNILIAFLLIGTVFALVPRNKAPQFKAIAVHPDNSFSTVNLKDYSGDYVVLLFYPFDFTYVCPTQIISFSDSMSRFKELKAHVLGISVDSHFSHLAWRKTARENGGLGQISFPLLSDITKDIAQAYGVLVENPEDTLYGATLRGLFIIDGNGMVRSSIINDQQVGRSVDETLRLIKAFQYTDKNGVVCPANWQPGSKTIIPDQEKMKQYFKQL